MSVQIVLCPAPNACEMLERAAKLIVFKESNKIPGIPVRERNSENIEVAAQTKLTDKVGQARIFVLSAINGYLRGRIGRKFDQGGRDARKELITMLALAQPLDGFLKMQKLLGVDHRKRDLHERFVCRDRDHRRAFSELH